MCINSINKLLGNHILLTWSRKMWGTSEVYTFFKNLFSHVYGNQGKIKLSFDTSISLIKDLMGERWIQCLRCFKLNNNQIICTSSFWQHWYTLKLKFFYSWSIAEYWVVLRTRNISLLFPNFSNLSHYYLNSSWWNVTFG